MLTTLISKFSGPAESASRISAEIDALSKQYTIASVEYDLACLDIAAEVDGAEERKHKAETDKVRIAKRREESQAALRGLAARQANEAAAEKRAEFSRRWADTERIANDRAALAADLEKAIKQFGGKLSALLKSGSDLLATAPIDPNNVVALEAAVLSGREAVLRAVRLEMVRADMPWAEAWPWGKEGITPLTKYVDEGNTVILRAKSN